MADDLISPDELRRISEAKEMAELKKLLARKRKIEKDADALYNDFMQREIRPDARQRISSVVRAAAERGEREIMAFRFNSEWTTDKGRAINNFDADWPRTLTGFAKRAYDYYEVELRPLGYRVRAEVLNYPNGMPGDVGLFLSW